MALLHWNSSYESLQACTYLGGPAGVVWPKGVFCSSHSAAPGLIPGVPENLFSMLLRFFDGAA